MKPTAARLSVAERSAPIDRTPDPELIARFVDDLDRLVAEDARLGIAVSGGPDSLALLLLAHGARPGLVEAATIDHGLRPESADEARMVAALCAEIGVPHEVLPVEVAAGNVQANARAARYKVLEEWVGRRELDTLLTAHHADDQAETLLMRLNRGSGPGGLAGVRAKTEIPGGRGVLARPLLGWRKEELEQLVASAGINPARDPSNESDDFDRVRIRKALADTDWIDPQAFAQSAAHLSDAQQALQHYAEQEWAQCVETTLGETTYCPAGPRVIRLMVLSRAIEELGDEPRMSQVAELLESLEAGQGGNLAGVLAKSTKNGWVLRREPPRR